MPIQLQISDLVNSLLQERYIQEDDIKPVIESAETSGEKLYQPGTDVYLAKKTIGEATFYVSYSPSDAGYIIHTAYVHRSLILED